MKEKLTKAVAYLPYLLLIMILVFICIPKNAQNDLYFDLRSAKDILKYGLDFKDHFCFIPGLTYLYHHYLYDLILYGIFKMGEFKSLFIFFLSIYTSFGFLVFYVTNKYTNNKIISLINSLISIFLMKAFFVTRVQSLTYILFYLEIYFLNKLYDEGKTKYSILLIITSILVVNLHMPVWIIYLVFFLPFFQEIVFDILKDFKISKYFSKKLEMKSPKNLKLFLITFGIVILTGLLSPFKLQPYTFFLQTINNEGYSIINEMKKTVLMEQGFLVVLMLVTIISLVFTNKKINIRNIFYIIGLGLMSLFANRHIAYFLLIIPTVLTVTLFKDIKLKDLKKINLNIIYTVLSIILIITYIMCFLALNLSNFNFHEEENYPVKSAQYIKENLDYKNIKLYNEFNFGSYLAYKNIPIFIDSRAEVYMKQFNNSRDVIQDYINSKEYANYQLIFNGYDFDYALVYKDTDIYHFLKEKDNCKVLYEEQIDGNTFTLFNLK